MAVAVRKRTSRPRFWLILAVLVAVAAVFGIGSQTRILRMQNDTLIQQEAQQAEMMAENVRLQRELEFADTDEYIIRQARETKDMLMPGEILFTGAE